MVALYLDASISQAPKSFCIKESMKVRKSNGRFRGNPGFGVINNTQNQSMQCHNAFKSVLEVDVSGRHCGCKRCQSGGRSVTESKGIFCRARGKPCISPESPCYKNFEAKDV